MNATPQKTYDGGVLGTKNVLESVSQSGSVKRVLYTSSTAAVMHPRKEGYEFTEKDWGSDNQRKENWVIEREPYPMAKVEAEKMAYKWADENGTFDVISNNPCHVLGPVMCTSHHEIWQRRIGWLVEGRPLDKFCWNITDTRDIAEVQRLSAESSVCKNGSRYCLVRNPDEPEPFVHEIQARLQKMYPQYEIAGEADKGKNRCYCKCSNGLMRKELGIVPYSLDETL